MSEIIDRGAKAMREKRKELITQPLDRIWPDLMKAVLESMMQPTKDMEHQGCLAAEDGVKYEATNERSAEVHEDAARNVWQAMLESALK